MLVFPMSKLSQFATMMIAAILAASCSYDPPALNPGSGEGGAGGSNAASSSSTSSSSTSSSSTSSSSTSSSSSGGSTEDCTNDMDDDANGSVDCLDPTCVATHQCVPIGPMDPKWSPPFHGLFVDFNADAPACASGEMPTVYGVGPSPDGCSGCSCEITGTMCTGAELTCYSTNNCTNGMQNPLLIKGTSCTNIVNTPYASCDVSQPPSFDPNNAQCIVTSGEALIAPDSFEQKILRCDPPTHVSGGCVTGKSCNLRPAPEYNWQCIAATGNQSCPANWPITMSGYQGWTDTRGCTSCACDAKEAACAANNIFTKHPNAICELPAIGGIAPNTCAPVVDAQSIGYMEQPPIVLPQGCNTMQTGKLDRGVESTICCRPAVP